MLTMENIFSEIIENGGSTPCRKVNEIASRFPERVAFRDKRFGIWSEISYQSFWDQAQWVGCALNYFGVDRFDKAAVHSENGGKKNSTNPKLNRSIHKSNNCWIISNKSPIRS